MDAAFSNIVPEPLLRALIILESWTVRIAFAIGMLLLFPGISMIVYDAFLYLWRSFHAALRGTQPLPAVDTTEGFSGSSSNSSSNSSSDAEEVPRSGHIKDD